jgi:hypothetical protein
MSSWSLPVETFDPFRLWLHRPLIDLGPAPTTPSFLVHAVELDYRTMVEEPPRPRLQISISPSFRDALATAAGRPEFAVRTCGRLPAVFRTERWSTLCDLVESWNALPPERRVRVCWTLAKLGLYDDILNLVWDGREAYAKPVHELPAMRGMYHYRPGFRVNFFFREYFVYLYDEFLSPGKMSSRS